MYRLKLFGSVARGQSKPSSDVDLLLDWQDQTLASVMTELAPMAKHLGRRLDIFLGQPQDDLIPALSYDLEDESWILEWRRVDVPPETFFRHLTPTNFSQLCKLLGRPERALKPTGSPLCLCVTGQTYYPSDLPLAARSPAELEIYYPYDPLYLYHDQARGLLFTDSPADYAEYRLRFAALSDLTGKPVVFTGEAGNLIHQPGQVGFQKTSLHPPGEAPPPFPALNLPDALAAFEIGELDYLATLKAGLAERNSRAL